MRKASVTQFGTSFAVHALPVLRDNFSYVVQCHKTNRAAVIDVSQVKPILSYLKQLDIITTAPEFNLKFSVLTTHKHSDHSAGNKDMVKLFPSLKIYGGAKDHVPCATHPVEDKDEFSVGSLRVKVLFAPCHTSGHVLYYVYDPSDASAGSALFSGDTLFVGGIGAFFEGRSADMVSILDRIATELPHDTRVFCGHEYTVNFLKFAKTIDPTNNFILEKLEFFESLVAKGEPTVPSTLEDELRFNVFMRTRDSVVAAAVHKEGASAVEVMEALYNACP